MEILIKELLEALHVEKEITVEDIPNVDLYVDQVVQLFENNYSATTRNEKEKVLTKTMINNYAKGKLFFPIKNKKYSKEHIMLISLIYQLKGALSISDIKTVLTPLNEKIEAEEAFDLEVFYEEYLSLTKENVESFKREVDKNVDNVQLIADTVKDEQLEKILLITSFITLSNLYRRLAEKLVDHLDDSESTSR